jgi:2-keto-4-pentenoate hydratase/2-oxohepta-3-ene-1,7-dioic acid hydratase in catechol pathway
MRQRRGHFRYRYQEAVNIACNPVQMKLARFLHQGRPGFGIAVPGGVIPVDPGSGCATIAAALDPAARPALERAAAGTPVGGTTPLVPIDLGARLFCIGVNYRSHVDETNREVPPQPSVFIRTQESVVANGAPMLRPPASNNFDFEGELGVVIGVRGRAIDEADALEHVGGYTCFNDGSIRDFQKHSVTSGKNFEASGACGPWIVLTDEIPDPSKLTLVTRLNGAEVQRSTTDLLIYGIPRLIAYISTITTLEPGDIIATGTPAGVGHRRDPQLWMKPGDTIEVDISSIGVLSNPISQGT